jgi:hypothetical protein
MQSVIVLALVILIWQLRELRLGLQAIEDLLAGRRKE